jgi:RsiW-degrading membrane proteinase PrsW (M82 family)
MHERQGPGSRILPLAALAIALAGTGCNSHLLGTRDVTLEYQVTLEATAQDPNAPALELVRHAVSQRLSAAQISADIETAEPDKAFVTIDESSADAVDELLAWRGGLRVYEVDPRFSFSPESTHGLTAKTGTLPDGAVEHYFVGTSEDVFRAVRASVPPPGHRVVVDADSGSRARTRVVVEPPLADLAGGIERVGTRGGRTLALTLRHATQTTLSEAIGRAESEDIAFVRDASVVSLQTQKAAYERASEPALLVSVGDDIYAYTRAQHIRRLLESGTLPVLVRLATTRNPANWPLAIASLLFPMLLSFGWLFFVRRFDRARPEPVWLVLATFALGGVSVVPAGLLEILLPAATPYLNPTLMTLGGQLMALPIALVVFTVVVGLSEEGSKMLAAWAVASRRREFDEPVDGIVYGAAAALGFAAVENVRYFAEGRMGATLVVMRAFTAVPAHMFFGAIWGYALGRKLVAPRTSLALYLLLAALMHGAFDTFLSIEGLGLLALAVNLALASMFILFLRSALRHGVVTPEAARVDPTSRELYPMGSRALFAFFAVGMHVIAALIFGLGAYVQARDWRVGFGFIGFASALLGVFGVMAYGLTETMPLDVVVDDYGVTFGGTAVRWDAISRYEHRVVRGGRMHEIRLGALGGSLCLGPGPARTVDQLARVIAARIREHQAMS